MLLIVALIIFILGYLAIAFEHPLQLNKAASALLTGSLCWLMYFLYAPTTHEANEQLLHHLGEIASILFFLLGAMTIVEVIASYKGFAIITNKITTTSKSRLLLIVSLITFFLSALLDNLTTAIVMASVCQKLLSEKEDRIWFAGMVVIAANSGGAWSPLGDVTTTMLWIGGQITAVNIIIKTLVPSLFVCAVPLIILIRKFKGQRINTADKTDGSTTRESKIILGSGIALLLFVPIFKTVTHMPPFMGMLTALSMMWIISSILHSRRHDHSEEGTVHGALRKVDTPSILFFLGILLAVSALQSMGLLKHMAVLLSEGLGNHYLIGIALGLLSAIVDNVPLVAAAQGMYSLTDFPTDHSFWQFLALTTGTGGSAIIIGSAAGVALMGIEKINFIWYLKKISWLAIAGFIAGALVFIAQEILFQ
jgi:Na+/H+ antiporter NhaD/arsenite permease-like protein